VEVLKQFKAITLVPTCFGSRWNHHQGAVLYLAKTTDMVFLVLVDMDSVNAMVAYRPVVQACARTPAQQADMPP
jgi:RES domain-containing protein